jgi:hypothetical protein
MSTKKLISLFSAPYSGSTIIAKLLQMHSDTVVVGESYKYYDKFFRNLQTYMSSTDIAHIIDDRDTLAEYAKDRCSCQELLTECPFWSQIHERVIDQIDSETSNSNFVRFRFPEKWYYKHAKRITLAFAIRGHYSLIPPPYRSRINKMVTASDIYHDTIREIANKPVIIDSSKEPFLPIFLHNRPDKDSYIIYLVRDGRAQIYSQLRWKRSKDVITATQNWVNWIQSHRHLLEKWVGPSLVIRYEDFCRNPLKVINTIYEFSGMSCIESLDLELINNFQYHMMGNAKVRMTKVAEIVDNQSWRNHLTEEQLKQFETYAGWLNRELGYE